MDTLVAVRSRFGKFATGLFPIVQFLWPAKDATCKECLSLPMLPVEIIQFIRDLLLESSLSSAVSFAITSRTLLRILGNECLHSLRSKDQVAEKKVFLLLMEKDLPNWQLCHPCSLFHPVNEGIGPESKWRSREEASCVQKSGVIFCTKRFRVRYKDAQLLMNRYRFGLPYAKDLNRLKAK